ncbi:DUF3179 domain-containing (seleno)protein [Roseibium sp. RKSG952]|uniref:DUF3179 domain-containing (seleno)protein n=1 Tax=Roseibium sp. RKSG952 TaxID=2529384 RepID=UPI0012BD212B|nr:DUF3179 domain-containing (seleno)protein [Roseibium sp. RKSG952]MTI02187.1 DUF3179 domain-containing protein [Roseibium sp. RKSG952]
MVGNLVFALGLIVSLGIGFVYFRDLGDVSQMLLKVKRKNMLRFIRHEYRLIGVGLGGFAVATLAHFLLGGGPFWLWLVAAVLTLLLYGFPYVWVHLGLRNQLNDAQYFPIEEARKYVGPTAPVIVIEHNGHARAHPDAQIMRPHLAGDVDGLGGEDVVMTYCAMANLGQGYSPRIEGRRLNLEVLAQHGNNLILRDNDTGEPIQHIYGFREADRDPNPDGPACPIRPEAQMKPWPTFRMTFRGFQKAYPEGEVFLNKPSSNPLLRLLDMMTEITFGWGIGRQHQEDAPVMDNIDRSDHRLPNKTYVWGITIGKDAACWTDDFIVENNWIVNTNVGGRNVVVSLDPKYESLGVWYNDFSQPVTQCDFWGHSDLGQLTRVETLRAGVFWHVWSEFFPNTDINRVGISSMVIEGAAE